MQQSDQPTNRLSPNKFLYTLQPVTITYMTLRYVIYLNDIIVTSQYRRLVKRYKTTTRNFSRMSFF